MLTTTVALSAAAFLTTAAPARAARVDRVERQTVVLVNRARRAHGLPALRISPRLTSSATAHSAVMAGSGVMGHGAWFGRISRAAGTGTVGEVVAYVRAAWYRQARIVVRGWLRSPRHRAVILSRKFHRAGIARHRRRGSRTTYFTLDTAR